MNMVWMQLSGLVGFGWKVQGATVEVALLEGEEEEAYWEESNRTPRNQILLILECFRRPGLDPFLVERKRKEAFENPKGKGKDGKGKKGKGKGKDRLLRFVPVSLKMSVCRFLLCCCCYVSVLSPHV